MWWLQEEVAPLPLGAGPALPAGHPWVSQHALQFCSSGDAQALWDLLSYLPPLALPMWQCKNCYRGFDPTAGSSSCDSLLAGLPELPYGSRCLESEPWAELGVERLGWLCHPSNVPAKQGSAARRNVILMGPANAQQLRSEQRGSCQSPWTAGNSLLAF